MEKIQQKRTFQLLIPTFHRNKEEEEEKEKEKDFFWFHDWLLREPVLEQRY